MHARVCACACARRMCACISVCACVVAHLCARKRKRMRAKLPVTEDSERVGGPDGQRDFLRRRIGRIERAATPTQVILEEHKMQLTLEGEYLDPKDGQARKMLLHTASHWASTSRRPDRPTSCAHAAQTVAPTNPEVRPNDTGHGHEHLSAFSDWRDPSSRSTADRRPDALISRSRFFS